MEKSKINTGMDGANGAKAGLDYSKINKDPNRKMTQKELETELYDYGMNRKMTGYNTTAADELYDIAGVALTPTRNLINSLFNKGGDKKPTVKTSEDGKKATPLPAPPEKEKPKTPEAKSTPMSKDQAMFIGDIIGSAVGGIGGSLSSRSGDIINSNTDGMYADVGAGVAKNIYEEGEKKRADEKKLDLEKQKLDNEKLNILRKSAGDSTGKLNVGGFSPQEAKELVPGLLKKYNLADNKRNKELITSALISGAGDVEGVEVGGIGAWLKPGLQQSDTMKVQLPRNRAITTEF